MHRFDLNCKYIVICSYVLDYDRAKNKLIVKILFLLHLTAMLVVKWENKSYGHDTIDVRTLAQTTLFYAYETERTYCILRTIMWLTHNLVQVRYH